MDIEQVHQAYKDIVLELEEYKNGNLYSMGYNAGIQEGRSMERDYWMPRYDNLLKQFQPLLVSEARLKRLYSDLVDSFTKLLRIRNNVDT